MGLRLRLKSGIRADTKALTGIRAGDFEVIQTLPPPVGDTVAWKEAPWKKPE